MIWPKMTSQFPFFRLSTTRRAAMATSLSRLPLLLRRRWDHAKVRCVRSLRPDHQTDPRITHPHITSLNSDTDQARK